MTKDYCQGIEYKDGKLEAVYGPEGRLSAVYDQYGVSLTHYRAEYWLKDHLGNTRLAFSDENHDGAIDTYDNPNTPENESEVLQENHYYPFGLNHEGPWYGGIGPENKYQYNGKELNEDFGLNWYDFGARWQDPAIGRFLTVDPSAEKYTSLSPYHYGYNSPIMTIDPDGMENIVVVGAQNDSGAGNKLMFVNQALRSMRIWSKKESEESRTMILFKGGYSTKQLVAIAESVSSLGGKLVLANSSEDMTNYLNSSDIHSSTLSESRMDDKITDLDIYAHGTVGAVEFGYLTPSQESYRFDESDVTKLNAGAFASGACINSYACRTGLGNSSMNYTSLFGDPRYYDSLAKKLADQTETPVKAFAVRTSYAGTLGNAFDRRTNNPLYPLPVSKMVDGAVLTPNGANRPVTGGFSPIGLPRSMMYFAPKRK